MDEANGMRLENSECMESGSEGIINEHRKKCVTVVSQRWKTKVGLHLTFQ